MFELAFGNAERIFRTTRGLARHIRKQVRKETHGDYPHHAVEDLKRCKEQIGLRDIVGVEKALDDALKSIRKGEEINLNIEGDTAVFLMRVIESYNDDVEEFDKIAKLLLELFKDENETINKIQRIMQRFKKEHEIIHEELLKFARVMKDQDYENVRLRDVVLNPLFEVTREGMKARRLKREARIEGRETERIEHEEKTIASHLKVIFEKHKGTEADKAEIKRSIDHIMTELDKADSHLNTLLDHCEFLLKLAVMLTFKLAKGEMEVEAALKLLREITYPKHRADRIDHERGQMRDRFEDKYKKIMHMMYQVLHKET